MRSSPRPPLRGSALYWALAGRRVPFPTMRTRRCSVGRSLAVAVSVVVTILVAGCAAADQPDESPSDDALHPSLHHLDVDTAVIERADGISVEVVVALPETRRELARGLMDVPELADGTGMLFDFGGERTGGFWMKDTLVPLDIAFAAEDGEILSVLPMEPCPAEPCPTYDPELAYRFALEVPFGWLAANDLGVGDRLVPPAA